MAVPVRGLVGAMGGSTGAPVVSWPVGHAANDIGILVIMQTRGAIGLTLSGPGAGDWTQVASSPQEDGTIGDATSVRLSVWWARASSGSMADVTVDDDGDQRGKIFTIAGCVTSGNPVNVAAGNTTGGSAATAVTIPGAVTTKTDCLILAIVANSADVATPETSNWANASLASFSEWDDENTASGGGGGFGVATGGLAAGGTYGATTADLVTSSLQGRLSLALLSTTSTDLGGVFEGLFAGATGNAASVTTPSRTSISGSAIFLAQSCNWHSSGISNVPSDSKGNTWIEDDAERVVMTNAKMLALARNFAGTRGTLHTLTNDPTEAGAWPCSVIGAEYSGLDIGATPLTAYNEGSSTAPTCSINVGASPHTVIAICTYGSTGTNLVCSNGTERGSVDVANAFAPLCIADKVRQTGTVTFDFTITAGGARPWGVMLTAIPEEVGVSAALTGTALAGMTEADVVAGGKTIVITLTGDTFIP
jgi:hypothetical protein